MEADIRFLCGHMERVELDCTRDKAEPRAKRLGETRVCSKCYKENRNIERLSIATDLPKLKGTEKQIAWANNLRAKLIQKFPDHPQEAKQAIAALSLDAKWWIDHRDEVDDQLIERIRAWLPA